MQNEENTKNKLVQIYLIDGHRGMGKSTISERLAKEFEDQAKFYIFETGVFYTNKKTKQIMDPSYREHVRELTEIAIENRVEWMNYSDNIHNKGVILVLGRDTVLVNLDNARKIKGVDIVVHKYLIRAKYEDYKKINIPNKKFSNYKKTWNNDESIMITNTLEYDKIFKIKNITDNKEVYNYIKGKIIEGD